MTNIKKVLIGAFIAVMAFATTGVDAAYMHTTTLKYGSRSSQVMSLQQTLNMTSCKVAVAGRAGSPGMETSYFGTATVVAVKCFQASHNLVADAIVGPATGAKLAMVTGTVTPSGLPAGCTSTVGFSPVNGQSCAGGPTTPQSGPVSASLSATTPAAGYIIDKQATAGLLDVNFTGNGTVSSVTLTRSGISDQNTLSNIYLYDGATRLTDGYSFNNAGQVVINNLNIMVSGSKTISVKADVYSSASTNSSTIAVALTSFASGTSVNNVNIQGNLMNVASGGALASLSFPSINSVSASSVNAGTSGYTVWRQAVQINTRALWLKAANFRVTGSAPADALSNVRLYVDGVDTGKTANMSMINGSSYLSFDLMSAPLVLNTGSHTLEVRGDIVKGSSYNFTVSLQQAADLMVMDPQVGVNIAVTSFTSSTAGTITIYGGTVTQNIDPTYNSMTNATGGASNATIGKWKLRGYGEDVKVYTLAVTPTLVNTCFGATSGFTFASCTGGTAAAGGSGLQNVTVYFNGTQIGTQTPSWTSGAITLNLGSQMIIPAGVDSMLEVRADLRSASAGGNYTAGTVGATTSIAQANVEGMTSHTNTNFPSPLNGSTHTTTIQTGNLGIAKNAGVADQSINPNTSAVKIGSFVIQNQSSSESVRVTTLKVDLTVVTAALTNYSSLYTSENSNPVQPQATNTFSANFELAPGATKTVDVFANTSSATTGTIQSTLTVSSIGVSSNVSATSSAIAGQTMTLGAGTVTNPPTFTASASASSQYIAAAGGAMDAVLARYNFQSTSGASTITELKFTTTGTAGAITSVKVNGVSAPVIGTLAWLTGLSIPVVQGGSGANVDVMISYANVGISGIASASTGGLDLTYVKYTSGGTTAEFSPTVSSNTMTLVGSKPVVALGLPNGAVGSSTTGLSVGTKYVADIRVTADAKGDVKVVTIPLTFTGNAAGTTTTPGTLTVKNAAGSTIATAVIGSVTGSGTSAATATITFTGGYTISAGQTETFKIEVPVTAVSGTGASLATGLGAAASFTWTDVAGNGTAAAGAGTLILNYPTSSVSMTN